MARIRLQGPDVDLEEPILVEGFPGLGLVGKIATDHLIREREMRYYASVDCEGLPSVGVYREGDRTARPPVRLYVDAEADLLALQSDAPIRSDAVETVADCLTEWLATRDATPFYLSGLPADGGDARELYGVATGDAATHLADHDVARPPEDGLVTGPTGALLERAAHRRMDSIGLVVEANPKFPDPQAASVLLEAGIAPIAGIEVDVADLLERAEQIREQREQFARQMQQLGQEESSQAQPLRMYH